MTPERLMADEYGNSYGEACNFLAARYKYEDLMM